MQTALSELSVLDTSRNTGVDGFAYLKYIGATCMFHSQRPRQNQIQNSEQLLSHLTQIVNQLHLDSKTRLLLNPLKWLDQVQFIVFTNQGTLSQQSQRNNLQQLCCQYCGALTKNVLLLLIHLGIIHDNDTFSYEISEGDQLLTVTKQLKMAKKDIISAQKGVVLYNGDYFQRLAEILISALAKITRAQLPQTKNAFYHSTDIFRQIANDSDSEAEQIDVIYKHQHKRLSQFNDISKSEMKFYCLWNEFIHNLKKSLKSGVFSREYVVNHLKEFVVVKELAGLRVQLITHLNAMWCYGVIDSNEVIYRLLDYDRAQTDLKVEEK